MYLGQTAAPVQGPLTAAQAAQTWGLTAPTQYTAAVQGALTTEQMQAIAAQAIAQQAAQQKKYLLYAGIGVVGLYLLWRYMR